MKRNRGTDGHRYRGIHQAIVDAPTYIVLFAGSVRGPAMASPFFDTNDPAPTEATAEST